MSTPHQTDGVNTRQKTNKMSTPHQKDGVNTSQKTNKMSTRTTPKTRDRKLTR